MSEKETPYFQHLSLRQNQIIAYINQYINLKNAVVIIDENTLLPTSNNENWFYMMPRTMDNLNIEPEKRIIGDLQSMPLQSSSIPNMIIPIGSHLQNIKAMLFETHNILKNQGFLLFFYPINRLFWENTSPTIKQFNSNIAFNEKKIRNFVVNNGFVKIEFFSISSHFPWMVNLMPFLIGRWDGWMYKSPLFLGQYGVMLLQKTTHSKIGQKTINQLSYPLTKFQLSLNRETTK